MEIKVSEIPTEGLKVELAGEPAEYSDLDEDIKVSGPVKAKFSVKKLGGEVVYLSGELKTALDLECSSCAKGYVMDVVSSFDLDLHPAVELGKEDEKELHAADMDVEYYENDTVDLTAILREQILLQAPIKALCAEECKGLCQFCGKDLNTGPCDCEPPSGHPGLSGLKDFFK